MDNLPADEPSTAPRHRRLLMRISCGIIAAGGLLAVLAAGVGGEASRRSALSGVHGALLLRDVAAMVMLVGLIGLLAAYRLDRIAAWWGNLRRVAVDPSPASGWTWTYLPAAILFAAFWIAGGFLPRALVALMVLVAGAALPAIAAIVAIYARGPLRAFAVGCLFPLVPLAMDMHRFALAYAMQMGPLVRRELQSDQFYWTATATLVLALFTGLLCIAVRAIVVRSYPENPGHWDA